MAVLELEPKPLVMASLADALAPNTVELYRSRAGLSVEISENLSPKSSVRLSDSWDRNKRCEDIPARQYGAGGSIVPMAAVVTTETERFLAATADGLSVVERTTTHVPEQEKPIVRDANLGEPSLWQCLKAARRGASVAGIRSQLQLDG